MQDSPQLFQAMSMADWDDWKEIIEWIIGILMKFLPLIIS
jgi:hypothetical protein